MRQQLEKSLYNARLGNNKERIYQVGDLESLSATIFYTGEPCGPKFTKNTGYFPLSKDGKIGVTHHKEGLGKLKYNEGGVEYGVPIIDIINKPLKKWRIEKK